MLKFHFQMGNVDMVRTLLSANADPGIHNEAGMSFYIRIVFFTELLILFIELKSSY